MKSVIKTQRDVWIYFVLLIYLKPMNVSMIDEIDTIYKILKIVITLVLLCKLFQRRINISKASYVCVGLLLVWGGSVFLNNASLLSRGQEILSVIGMIILCSYCVRIKEGMHRLIRCLSSIAQIYILLNFVTVILDKPFFVDAEVEYVKYFLGSDNYTAFILIPLCGYVFASDKLLLGKITLKAWAIAVIGWLCLAIPKAVTGMVAYGALLLLVAMINNPFIKKFATIKVACIFSVLFLLFVLNPSVRTMLENSSIVGKVGLNSREVIWPMTISAFLKKPLLGYGTLSQLQVDSYLLYGTTHAHNVFLEFLLDVGIVGCIVAAIWIICVYKNMKTVSDDVMQILKMCMLSYVLCSVFDFYIGLIYFWQLVIIMDSYKEYKLGGLYG